MKHLYINFEGINYEWSASQGGENVEFILFCTIGEIYVQVQIGESDQAQSQKFFQGTVDIPITENTALEIVSSIIKLGYFDSYFDSDVGLI